MFAYRFGHLAGPLALLGPAPDQRIGIDGRNWRPGKTYDEEVDGDGGP